MQIINTRTIVIFINRNEGLVRWRPGIQKIVEITQEYQEYLAIYSRDAEWTTPLFTGM